MLGAALVSTFQGAIMVEKAKRASLGAAWTLSTIGLIVSGACFLSIARGYFGVPKALAL
jgi:hypothetical protein